jgi:hypothetical protein
LKASLSMPTDAIAAELRENLGIDLTARMLEVNPQMIGRWARGDQVPTAHNEQLLRAVFQIYLILISHQSPTLARGWLLGLNPNFEYEQPADLIAAGQLRDVLLEAENYVNS